MLGSMILWRYNEVYLNPKSTSQNSPKPIRTAIKAILSHSFGVQVVLWDWGLPLGGFSKTGYPARALLAHGGRARANQAGLSFGTCASKT